MLSRTCCLGKRAVGTSFLSFSEDEIALTSASLFVNKIFRLTGVCGLKFVPKEPYLGTPSHLRGQPSSKKRTLYGKMRVVSALGIWRIVLTCQKPRKLVHYEIFRSSSPTYTKVRNAF